jgi:predicted transposase/invertase (TIGR01784 family)
MVYFDEQSPPELIEEAVKMDTAIQVTEDKMAKIMRDPGLLHSYDMFEQARIVYKMGIQGARQEGIREGEQKRAVEIAKTLKAMGLAVEQIHSATGLSAEKIVQL